MSTTIDLHADADERLDTLARQSMELHRQLANTSDYPRRAGLYRQLAVLYSERASVWPDTSHRTGHAQAGMLSARRNQRACEIAAHCELARNRAAAIGRTLPDPHSILCGDLGEDAQIALTVLYDEAARR